MINSVSNRLARKIPFFYGYVMIPIAMLMQICTSPGQTFAISAFTPALRESLNLSDSKLSFAYMMGTFLAAFPLSTIGPLSDRWGIRLATVIVATALSITCWCASLVSGFFGLLAVFFMLRFLGQGSLSLLSSNTVAMWFRSRIGRVSAAMSVGGAIAFAFVPEWISESIVLRGWRETYQLIAVVALVLLLPLWLLYRERPEDLGQRLDGLNEASLNPGKQQLDSDSSANEITLTLANALRHRSFYILSLTSCFWALAGTGVVFYLFTLCEDRDLAAGVPADLFKTLGFSMLAAQLIGGVLSDWLRMNRLLGIGMITLSAGMGFAYIGTTTTEMHLFAGLFGFGQGTLLATGAVVWVRYYGRTHLGSIRGTALSLVVAGSGCGPFVMGTIRDRFGTFDLAILIFFAGLCGLSIAAWWATPPERVVANPDRSEFAGKSRE